MTSIEPSAADVDLAPNGWPWPVLRGFRNGEAFALTDVYRRHVDEVAKQLRHGFGFTSAGRAHRFVGYGSAFELQDALHETFRRAFEPRAREGYDGIRPYGPYLRTIARNVVLRGFRQREVQFPAVGQADDATGESAEATLPDEAAPSPEQTVGRAQVQAVVQRYLETLPEVDRELLRLRFIEGQSQRDAADALGLGRQQVRGREVKLRKGLLAFLRRQGEEGLVPGGLVLQLMLVTDAVIVLREAADSVLASLGAGAGGGLT